MLFLRNDAKAETPVLWPPHAKSWVIGKDSDAGWDWGQEEKGTTEDEVAGWHHRLDGLEFEWTLGVGDGQGGLACCHSWGRKESGTTEGLNRTELNLHHMWYMCIYICAYIYVHTHVYETGKIVKVLSDIYISYFWCELLAPVPCLLATKVYN